MQDISKLYLEKELQALLAEARFGLEKESQRVTRDGALAKSIHPAVFGSRSFHPYIQTDFAETQLELITPVRNNEGETLRFLDAVSEVVQRSLDEDELIWPASMPPALPDNEEDIILAKLEPADVAYREGLSKVYGRRLQMVSGIHYNYEFSDDLLHQLWRMSAENSSDNQTFDDFRNDIYMKLARGYVRYQWLISYLFGASPKAEKGYFTNQEPVQPVRSIRNSPFGYRNEPGLKVSLDSLEEHYHDLAELVSEGKLSLMKEFYSPIRMRCGHHMEDLLDRGIHYIELRNFDLNPFEKIGMSLEACQFVHYFCLFLLFKEEVPDYHLGQEINDQVALENPHTKTAFYEEGKIFFKEFLEFAQAANLGESVLELIQNYELLLEEPEETLAARVDKIGHAGLLDLAKKYHQIALEKPYRLEAYKNLELSTQNLIFDAIQKGLSIDFLDEKDQFLRLTYAGHSELVKDGNMTEKDSMVAYDMMENKLVSKKLLAEAGFKVPKAMEFSDLAEAKKYYPIFANKAIVIKPKATNYGLGISIFTNNHEAGSNQANNLNNTQIIKQSQFNRALELAFKEDKSILIEDYAPGTEYRFFVIDGKTVAVLRRDGANVLGDGKQTIEQLIAEKNSDPLRGEGKNSPLKKIQITDSEALVLEAQALKITDIPKAGQKVMLRENSNISTGGDSIDVTDEMSDYYKEIAGQASESLGVKICGLDLIIPDLTESDPQKADYQIIEANYNPMMHMHLYPSQGKARRVTMDVLDFLFPEMKIL